MGKGVLGAAALLWAASGLGSATTERAILSLSGDTERVHDPVIAREGDTYYVFSTGGRPGQGVIPIRTSKDLKNWKLSGYVFEKLPEWATREIPKATGAWAPDISYFRGRYHLYYSVSTFGSRNSAIGLATNETLDPGSPKYRWVDNGMVLRSHEETDDWNAIDPNVALEGKNRGWLVWGSFWGGIKMRRLDLESGKLSSEDPTLYALASRPRERPVNGSIEGPFLVQRGGYWYLFVSFDVCCRGAQSTYKVAVGRARKVTGLYVDKAGKPMTEGGGTIVIEAAGPEWRGPGHQAVWKDRSAEYLVFHAYDGKTGRSHLQISQLAWEDGWPRVGTLR